MKSEDLGLPSHRVCSMAADGKNENEKSGRDGLFAHDALSLLIQLFCTEVFLFIMWFSF